MEYGAGKAICVGKFLDDGQWIDFGQHWSAVQPKLQHFVYADTGDDAALLLKDYHIRVKDLVFSALAGFDTDMGSIPRAFWTSVGHPFMASRGIQFITHDLNYCMNLMKQKASDDLLLDMLAAFGETTWYTRNKIWLAVRAGGWSVYPKTTKELETYGKYAFMTDISKTGGCLDLRLRGYGPRVSVRPEITLE